METAGEDPTLVSEFGKAFVEGIAGNREPSARLSFCCTPLYLS